MNVLCDSLRITHTDRRCYVIFCAGFRRICGTTGSNRSRFKILFISELFSHKSCETPLELLYQNMGRASTKIAEICGATCLWKIQLLNGIFMASCGTATDAILMKRTTCLNLWFVFLHTILRTRKYSTFLGSTSRVGRGNSGSEGCSDMLYFLSSLQGGASVH